MAKRKTRKRQPLGEPEETLVFWTGSLIPNALNEQLANEVWAITQLSAYNIGVTLGQVEVPNVPLSEVDNVKSLLVGLRVLGGTKQLTEKQ